MWNFQAARSATSASRTGPDYLGNGPVVAVIPGRARGRVSEARSSVGRMVDFTDEDLRGSRFTHVDLTGAVFRRARLIDIDVRGADLRGARFDGVELVDATITGEVENLTINGVEVSAYVNAELDRRDPDRVKMRPTDPTGFREAWYLLERLWDGTVERARALDPADLHVSVDEEWSFIETLRHLLFVTDSWVRRAILRVPEPWDPLDLPWDQMSDKPGIPRDREVRPSLDEVLAVRADRQATVRAFLSGLTDDRLDEHTVPLEGDSWPPARPFPVRECLSVLLNEEWYHRQFAERDLAVLERRRAEPSAETD